MEKRQEEVKRMVQEVAESMEQISGQNQPSMLSADEKPDFARIYYFLGSLLDQAGSQSSDQKLTNMLDDLTNAEKSVVAMLMQNLSLNVAAEFVHDTDPDYVDFAKTLPVRDEPDDTKHIEKERIIDNVEEGNIQVYTTGEGMNMDITQGEPTTFTEEGPEEINSQAEPIKLTGESTERISQPISAEGDDGVLDLTNTEPAVLAEHL